MSSQDQKIMFVFPGQGSQYVGMGGDLIQDFPVAQRLYQQANEIVGYDLLKLCLEGPEDDLKLTRHTQPALLTHSLVCLAVFRELTDDRVKPILAAGHSLGEYCALVAAGALDFETALRLVQKRGECMGTYGEGEMLAFPLHLDNVKHLAEKHFCAIAACNLPDQTVVGGRGEDLDRLTEDAHGHFPKKRPTRLKTEGAFHTFYMIAAALHFRPVLDAAAMAEPTVRVLSNYSGVAHDPDPAAIKTRLFFQLFHPVNWIGNLETAFHNELTAIVEFGGGLGSGPVPADKRPNLESMIKKAQRGSDYSIHYHAAINSQTLRETAQVLR
ncbi:Malonyl CoA-acyl carrier protein transacylase (fragment) [Candidatus Competibacter denitrificans Run_A_D11]|uniref:Malonyl CoA-acyl carrier protein transacylase n=1 Tax=Candidatus Competibacter denitrificans Run_A_D11 TaxID=1400863 RepID=W6MCY5_9GAMM